MPWQLALLIGALCGGILEATFVFFYVRRKLKQLGIYEVPIEEVKNWLEERKKNGSKP